MGKKEVNLLDYSKVSSLPRDSGGIISIGLKIFLDETAPSGDEER
jgi:hypothetical protein